MELKKDDSCAIQKSSFNSILTIPFFKVSLTKGTVYRIYRLSLIFIVYSFYLLTSTGIMME